MQITVIKINNNVDVQKAFDIRIKVFVEEQGVDKRLEYEHEEESTHFLAIVDGNPAGTARWRQTENGIKLERFAVLPQYRSSGVGAHLVKAVLNDVLPTNKKIYLNAQTQVVNFYAKYGFAPVGKEFEEAGIMHYKMEFIGK
jgi:predicted GNAT family N-acyltransferase